MVQWFSPGFSACIQRFETRLTSGILLDAGMSWRVQDLFVLCCRQVRFCPRPESYCVSSRFVVKRRIWNRTIHNFQYCTRHNINSYVGYRRLLTLESKSSSVDRLTLNPVNSIPKMDWQLVVGKHLITRNFLDVILRCIFPTPNEVLQYQLCHA